MKNEYLKLPCAMSPAIWHVNLHFTAMRLYYGILHAIQQACEAGIYFEGETYKFSISALRTTVLPSGETDNRQLKKAVELLGQVPGLVEEIKISPDGRSLIIRPNPMPFEIAQLFPEPYGQIDMKKIKSCRNTYEIILTDVVSQVHRMNYPIYDFVAFDDETLARHKEWKKAAAVLSERFGYTMLFREVFEPFTKRHLRTTLKIMHSSTKWLPLQFYAFGPSERLTECVGGKAKQLDRQEIQYRISGARLTEESVCGHDQNQRCGLSCKVCSPDVEKEVGPNDHIE